MKKLFGMALRQTTGFVESVLRLNWVVPDFSTTCRRPKPLAVNIPYHQAYLIVGAGADGICWLQPSHWGFVMPKVQSVPRDFTAVVAV